jgi:glycosyltransferase involved in cell wall biosynthesis
MMKAALVHYWLVKRRGGEKVLDAMAEVLPGADLISHVVDPALLKGPLEGRRVRQTFVGSLPFARRRYQAYLFLMPVALEMMDLDDYDLIVSSEAGPAKWIIGNPDAEHICYCHSPLRYIWDQRHTYLNRFPGPLRLLAEHGAGRMRTSDALSAMRVDKFIANSNFVAKRIWRYYRREAEVIHPPVDVARFQVREPEDYYLLAGEIRGYKGADAAVQACAELGRRLVIMGGGNDKSLRRLAGPKTEFLGSVSDAEFRDTLSRCRALLFPGVEDFGIVPVEAMASGRPVIGRAKGGLLDSVVHGETGLLYSDDSLEGLKRAILAFEAEERSFRPEVCVARAQAFRPEAFKTAFAAALPKGAASGFSAAPGAEAA